MSFEFEDQAIDPVRRELSRAGRTIAVEPKVFDLLIYLIENRDRIVTKDDLIAKVWSGRIVSDSALTSAINAARAAIGDSGKAQQLIRTSPRKGFRFVGVVKGQSAVENAAPLALPDKPSIAVLPFQNMSGDAEQDYFVDGLVDDIITALARFSSLFVIARNSSFTYRGRAVDVRLVGRELGVRYVLEGGARKAGDRLRVTGQLIEAENGGHIWADRYDGDLGDVFAFQDRIAEAVAGTIVPTIEAAEIERTRRHRRPKLEVYDLHLRALAQYYLTTPESYERSVQLFDQALALDPNYVPALLGALRSVAMRAAQGWAEREEVRDRSMGYTDHALRLDKDNAEVLATVARNRSFFFGVNEEAIAMAKHAVTVNPNSALAWMHCGWVHVYAGRAAVSIGHFQQAMRLSPRDPNNFEILAGLANAHIQLGEDGAAIAIAQAAVRQGQRFAPALRNLIAALANAGRVEEARVIVTRLRTIEPTASVRSFKERNALHGSAFTRITEGLRLAGLPE